MFTPTRDTVRQFFIDTWHKYHAQRSLSALEAMTLKIIFLHPEYHSALSSDFLCEEYLIEKSINNPFLHLSLHLAIAEQLSIDHPKGICDIFLKLCNRTSSQHEAEHLMMDSLMDMIAHTKSSRTPPDIRIYLNGLAQLLGAQ